MGKDNRYPGINPHLNSHLQHVEGWEDFHQCHLNDLRLKLESGLPPAYKVLGVDTLQTSPPEMVEAGKTLAGIAVMIERHPVTLIELLTPRNKPPGIHAKKYRVERKNRIFSGICLVEIDYLHAENSVDPRIPSYPIRDTHAYPYSIIVTNPRPEPARGYSAIYGYGVLDRLPIIDIPLDGQDVVRVDFNQVYNATFSGYRAFYEASTDYTREPVNFDAYSDEDKKLIRQHMAKINGSPQD